MQMVSCSSAEETDLAVYILGSLFISAVLFLIKLNLYNALIY